MYNVLLYHKHTLSYKHFFASMWKKSLLRKHPLNLGKISVVDFPFHYTLVYNKRLSNERSRAHQRQSKAWKCKFVVLLGRSLTLSGIEKTSTRYV